MTQTSMFGEEDMKHPIVDFFASSSHRLTNPVTHKDGPSSEATPPKDRRETNAKVVLEVLKRQPGSTARELYYNNMDFFTGHKMNEYEVSRRLTDLGKSSVISQGEVRECRATFRKGVTWQP